MIETDKSYFLDNNKRNIKTSIHSPFNEKISDHNSQVLARVYGFILSWPDPHGKKTKAETKNLGRDSDVGITSDTSFIEDVANS